MGIPPTPLLISSAFNEQAKSNEPFTSIFFDGDFDGGRFSERITPYQLICPIAITTYLGDGVASDRKEAGVDGCHIP